MSFNVNCKDCLFCHQFVHIDDDGILRKRYCCIFLGKDRKAEIMNIEKNIDCSYFFGDHKNGLINGLDPFA